MKDEFSSFLFVIIGKEDPVVRIQWGRLSGDLFKSMGFKKYLFKEYDGMVHSSNDQVMIIESLFFKWWLVFVFQEIKDAIAFIEQNLPKI